jgi:putative acetyltransferase
VRNIEQLIVAYEDQTPAGFLGIVQGKVEIFYKRFGFEVIDRTEFDEQGNPFPILKMRLK